MRISLISALLISLTAATAQAQQVSFQLDPAQTQVHFVVDSTLHTVHGTFKLKQGAIQFDPSTGKMSGSIVVDVTSGESGSAGRDRRMHQKVLQSDRFPEATFTPSQITGAIDLNGKSDVQVRGVLNLHGADHEMVLPAHVERNVDHLTVTTHFTVPYVSWGMKSPSTFIFKVNNNVDVEIVAVGKLGNL